MDNKGKNGSNSNDRIEFLKKREAEIRARLTEERLKQQKREWREYQRLKDIVGGALLAKSAEDAETEEIVRGIIKTAPITSEGDKRLLRAKGWL
jgi:hypothetical protein